MSTRVPLDYETKNKYHLQIRAFNKNAAKQSSSMEETCEITVIVNDVNEPPVWEDVIPEFVEGNGEGNSEFENLNAKNRMNQAHARRMGLTRMPRIWMSSSRPMSPTKSLTIRSGTLRSIPRPVH